MLTDTGFTNDLRDRRMERNSGVLRVASPLSVLAWQLPLGAVFAGLVSLALQWSIARLPIPPGSNVAEAILNLSSVILLGGLLALAALRRWSRWFTSLGAAGLAALGTLPLTFLLQGSRFYLFGLSGDQFFRTQYLTRLAASPELADGNYAGLPPYYPAGWFWLGGRFANLIGFPAWAAYKPWAIITMAVAPVLAFVLWSLVVRPQVALVMAALSCLVGLREASYEPYSWVLTAVLVPVTVIVWQRWRQPRSATRSAQAATVLGGLCLGTCAAVYTLLALYFAALLVVLAASAVVLHYRTTDQVRGGDSAADLKIRLWQPAGVAASRLAISFLVAMPVGLLVWTPYLMRLAGSSAESNPAGRFLPKLGTVLPTPMLELSVSGLVCLLGAVWLLWSWQRSDIAQALGLLVAGCYMWYAASTLALSSRTTLLPFRAIPLLLTCLVCAATLGAWQLVRWARRKIPKHRKAINRTTFAFTLIAMLSLTQTIPASLEEAVTPGLFQQAYATYDDAGHRARPEPSSSDGGAWNGEVISAIGQLARTQPQDTVVLTSETQLLALRPYRSFQTSVHAYANPLAEFDQRRALVESWSRSANAHELLASL